MIQLILDDSRTRKSLYPFTLTRASSDIRIGIFTIREKWQFLLGRKVRVNGDDYLDSPAEEALSTPAVFAGNIVPSRFFVQALLKGEYPQDDFVKQNGIRILQHPWHIFEYNDWAIREDFMLLTENRVSSPIPSHVKYTNPAHIFIEEGAKLEHCHLNAEQGPIYIGRNVSILDGAMIRGPFAACEGSVVKMGAKIYGATTIGPNSIVGGEIKNTVIFGNSNKAHDGYLGDSVLGEWCNLGAGTTNSNIKNTAAIVKVWDESTGQFIPAGTKCGLLMGDYSRASINTSFNTGTVVGACCNVFGGELTVKHIPSFTWGVKERYRWDKVIEDIANWKKLKNQEISEKEIQTLQHIFDQQ